MSGTWEAEAGRSLEAEVSQYSETPAQKKKKNIYFLISILYPITLLPGMLVSAEADEEVRPGR
jgi:hypothetical protein